MNIHEYHRRRQKSVIFVAFLLFALVLFLIQIWLFVMVLENILKGQTHMVVPATIGSFVLLGVNGWMMLGVNRLLKMR